MTTTQTVNGYTIAIEMDTPIKGHIALTGTQDGKPVRLVFSLNMGMDFVARKAYGLITADSFIKVYASNARLQTRRVGSNPEMAEMGNPRGDIYHTFAILEAFACNGEVYELRSVLTDLDLLTSTDGEKVTNGLEKLATRVVKAGAITESRWTYTRIAYGAEGWNDQALDDEINDAYRDGERHPMA